MKTICLSVFLVSGGLALGQGAPSAPGADEKQRAMTINDELLDLQRGADSSDARWQAIDAEIGAYQKNFGTTPAGTNQVVSLRKTELKVAKGSEVEGRYDALVQKLATDPVPQVAALVAKIAEFKSKPMELKFTAVDGRAVDLSKLRGKVVLLNFWATWNGPCVSEMPNIVATYKKYHDQGFEIIGISLDDDKSALTSFTTQLGMDWPQYFDGKGWNNAVVSNFGITSIPARWLIDKNGMLVTMQGHEDLAGQVAKLLAAP